MMKRTMAIVLLCSLSIACFISVSQAAINYDPIPDVHDWSLDQYDLSPESYITTSQRTCPNSSTPHTHYIQYTVYRDVYVCRYCGATRIMQRRVYEYEFCGLYD